MFWCHTVMIKGSEWYTINIQRHRVSVQFTCFVPLLQRVNWILTTTNERWWNLSTSGASGTKSQAEGSWSEQFQWQLWVLGSEVSSGTVWASNSWATVTVVVVVTQPVLFLFSAVSVSSQGSTNLCWSFFFCKSTCQWQDFFCSVLKAKDQSSRRDLKLLRSCVSHAHVKIGEFGFCSHEWLTDIPLIMERILSLMRTLVCKVVVLMNSISDIQHV